ncbi:receptor FtsY [Seminavis robusta]|uniref:Receptor FtsY n=1 Tax=Seminavis robusta TaxID=568900 RepID=A0A9N8H8U9_9STRA|nr:receptor FtsY [Seminavis robusta]|eukprot:Sro182_g079340.1 receptor FtsY (484) ;mRNA; f:43617-45435
MKKAILFVSLLLAEHVAGFRSSMLLPKFLITQPQNLHPSQSKTQLFMVFDFFKEKTSEGFDQLNRLADASYKGELGKGISDVAAYTTASNIAFANGLARSRIQLLQNLESLATGMSPEELLEDLQDILLQADLGIAVSEEVVDEVRTLRADSTTMLTQDDLRSILRGKLIEALITEIPGAMQFSADDNTPTVFFVMGANGMGKTTTIGKLAHRLKTEGNQTVLMAACDTFRAGAVEQLQQWAERADVDIYGPSEGKSTPSAVLYGALDKACKENYDTVLVDTSGRLSNNDALTAELAKMKKVIQKRLSVETGSDGSPIPNKQAPHETLLVLDAAQGRMALDSARVWDEEIGLSGLILTKLDGTARGGSVVAVSRDLRLPVKLIGVGEGLDDLRDFEPERFVEGLLGIGEAGGKPSSNSNEGAMLAARLDNMRQERDERAKVMAKQPVAAVAAPPPSIEMDDTGKSPARRSKPKNKKKKKKGRK